MKLKDILDNDIIFWLLCPFWLLYILWDCIYEDIKDIWDKYYLYFSDKKEYNHKYHPEPEIPWPTDPIERSKCPRDSSMIMDSSLQQMDIKVIRNLFM